MFETPRTRLRNPGRSKVAAPHHEAGRDRECIKLTGLRFWRNCAPRAQLAQGVADLMQGTAASLRSARTVETSLTVLKTVDESGDLLRCDLISKHDCNHSVLRSAEYSSWVSAATEGALMTTEFLLLFAVGFVAQLVDGALGMAFGVLSNTAMLALGLPPAQASAIVHTAEVFTTASSAASHCYHRNVDWKLVARLGIPGLAGAILGAWILSNVNVSSARRFVYAYLLLMGCYILWKSVRIGPQRTSPAGWTPYLGFFAGF